MSDGATNHVWFGVESPHALWPVPDAEEPSCCAYCGRRAERGCPDRRNEDAALPCRDSERRDYCSRECAIEFALTLHRRREHAMAQQSGAGLGPGFAQQRKRPTVLRQELTEIYEAAVVLANLRDGVLYFVEATDADGGMLERAPIETRLAREPEKANVFVDLRGFRELANDLCRLLGGADDDPKWLRGARKGGAAETWLEALVAFRSERSPNEVWPFAEDLSRAQITSLYEFYMNQPAIEATDRRRPAECG